MATMEYPEIDQIYRLDRERQKSMSETESGEAYEAELRALKDNLVAYQLAAAMERQKRDLLIATWRDILHSGLQGIGASHMIHLTHEVINSMDEFLNRAGGRRK